MKIKVLDISSGISLQLNKVYLIKFETASHFIIFENDIWYGVSNLILKQQKNIKN